MPKSRTGAVVLYDKGSAIQQAGYLVTMCQIKVASKSHSSRPMALTVQGNFMGLTNIILIPPSLTNDEYIEFKEHNR